MTREVGINIDLFRSNVGKLSDSLSGLQTNNIKTSTFSKTNINPFKQDLENMIKAVELLEKYKLILETDITTLKQTGESIREHDLKIALTFHPEV